MGNNINLCELLGLPEKVKCQRCKQEINSGWDDEDIECGDHTAKDGELTLKVYCPKCEYDENIFHVVVQLHECDE